MCRHYAFVMPIGKRTKALGKYEPDFARFDFHNQYRQKNRSLRLLTAGVCFRHSACENRRQSTRYHSTTTASQYPRWFRRHMPLPVILEPKVST